MTSTGKLALSDSGTANRLGSVIGSAADSIAHRNRVVRVRKNADGDIVSFRFADGRVIDYSNHFDSIKEF